MADAKVSKTFDHNGRVGSTPTFGTTCRPLHPTTFCDNNARDEFDFPVEHDDIRRNEPVSNPGSPTI